MPFSGIALAFWLIAAPQPIFDQNVTPWTLTQWQSAEGYDHDGKSNLLLALQAAGTELEILDKREMNYVFAKKEDLTGDLRIVRNRYNDLKDAPSLQEAVVFPERSSISDLLLFNKEYKKHLENMRAVWGERKSILDSLAETDALYEIWDAAKDANTEYYYVHIRRQALKKLKEKLGGEAFQIGEMPPHVPLWRFTPIR